MKRFFNFKYCPKLPAVIILACLSSSHANAGTVVHEKDRIVFCGDSITGQGGKGGPNGWVGLIGEGLAIAHPSGNQTLTALGGSGMTVGSWQNVEKKSRDNPTILDVPGVDVKATLDGGAEIVVIMLGMNDVLSPGVKNAPADLDAWKTRYHDLIEAIKARVHPRVVALATITPCTEDDNSPKNQVEKELNARLAALAQEEGAIVLPTHEAMLELLAAGRSYKSDFHVTVDFVHPGGAGHLAIAVGMLRGLGEGDAAAQIMEKHSKTFKPADTELPTLAYALTEQAASPDEAKRHFTIHYQWTPPAGSAAAPVVTANVPAGWQVTPASQNGAKGDFQVTGATDRIVNKVTLSAAAGAVKKDADINIPAGWRIAAGSGKGLGWDHGNSVYDPAQDHPPADDLLANDEAFSKPVEFATGDTPPWQYYRASFNFTGLDQPGSVDMAAVTFFKFHDMTYGVRWIYSGKDRAVDLNVGSRTFAGMFSNCVWLNGDVLYAGKIAAEPGHKKSVEGKLHSGWNRLLFKSTFVQWQWQFMIDPAGKPGDDLADLRYATSPPAAAK